jgi:hypothetical protein
VGGLILPQRCSRTPRATEDEGTSRFESTPTDALFIISLATAAIWELAAPGAVGEPFRTRDVAVARPN